VLAALENARREVARHLAGADPDRVTSADAAALVTAFAEIERLGASGKLLFARRAAQSTVWRDEGHRSAASWMAQKAGTGIAEALGALETSAALESLPETTEALRHGVLSSPQVKVIAGAADPHTEAGLLECAATGNLKGLKDAAAQVRAVAQSAAHELARYNALRATRALRHWTGPDGAFHLDARLAPDAGAKLLCALQPEADVRFDQGRKNQELAPPAAYLADALVALVCGEPAAEAKDGARRSPRATVSIRVDATALRRGHVAGGEMCTIPGVGPVPVAVARRQLSDATVKLLVVDGVDVVSVCHVGRTVPAHLQSALDERDPTCVVPECSTALGLQNHHWVVPYVDCKTTSVDNLARVCSWHHDLLSYEGYVLSGGPGAWEMRAPPGGCSFETGTPFDTS
jgi:hypothetical protein